MTRQATVQRETSETAVSLTLTVDGTGRADVSTGIPFLDHMLSLMTMHGLFDLILQAKGDLDVDYHHTVEDIGIVLGQGIKDALGDRAGIRRFGAASVPMDEALSTVVVDISGRPVLEYRVEIEGTIRDFDVQVMESFFKAVADHGGLTLHVVLHYGRDLHHILESVFKGLGKALDEACGVDARRVGVPSTKGRLQ
jgi:imidazoleglycerol-phosphate dehydratase